MDRTARGSSSPSVGLTSTAPGGEEGEPSGGYDGTAHSAPRGASPGTADRRALAAHLLNTGEAKVRTGVNAVEFAGAARAPSFDDADQQANIVAPHAARRRSVHARDQPQD